MWTGTTCSQNTNRFVNMCSTMQYKGLILKMVGTLFYGMHPCLETCLYCFAFNSIPTLLCCGIQLFRCAWLLEMWFLVTSVLRAEDDTAARQTQQARLLGSVQRHSGLWDSKVPLLPIQLYTFESSLWEMLIKNAL